MVLYKKSYRLQFNFWLDMEKPAEEIIADMIEVLKNKRQFAKTIRDGIRLIVDLRNGNTSVLLELFPHLRLQEMQAQPDRVGGDVELKNAILNLRDTIADSQSIKTIQSGIQSLNKPALQAPTFDDDDLDLELEVRKDMTKSNSGQNFINSLMALQQ